MKEKSCRGRDRETKRRRRRGGGFRKQQNNPKNDGRERGTGEEKKSKYKEIKTVERLWEEEEEGRRD